MSDNNWSFTSVPFVKYPAVCCCCLLTYKDKTIRSFYQCPRHAKSIKDPFCQTTGMTKLLKLRYTSIRAAASGIPMVLLHINERWRKSYITSVGQIFEDVDLFCHIHAYHILQLLEVLIQFRQASCSSESNDPGDYDLCARALSRNCKSVWLGKALNAEMILVA